MTRIVVVGEGMLELAAGPAGALLGYGGDTLNTAIHLARHGHDVAFASALGTDPWSADLRARWAAEGLDTTLLLADPARLPGLYGIHVDAGGERSFTYWRGDSAARAMFALSDSDRLCRAIGEADLLVFSLISLAILPPDGRRTLLALAGEVRGRGGRVAFDGNYRPRLWHGADEALAARAAGAAACDIGLPTLEDETALCGERDPAAVAAAWSAAAGCETVVKLGAGGCLVDGIVVPPPVRLDPVDTSGAGDAFNAGYLHARLAGATPVKAAAAGHRLAGWTLMHRGAVPARTDDAPYGG